MQLAHTVNGYFIFDSSLCTNDQKGFRLSSVQLFGSVMCKVRQKEWQKLSFKHLRAMNFRPICLFKDKNSDNST